MKEHKKRPLRKVILVSTLSLLVIIGIGLAGSAYVVRQRYTEHLEPFDSSFAGGSTTITIERGATAKQVAVKLVEAQIIRSDWAFEWYLRVNDLRDKLQAGSYKLSPALSIPEVVGIITEGKVETDLVTIVPGERLSQIERTFIAAGFSEQSIKKAFDPATYPGHPALVDKPIANDLEGYLYPESYQKTADTQPEQIIRNALDQMAIHLTPEIRAGLAKQGLNAYEGIIIASIVEQEENKINDRSKVAQVFLKRHKIQMELGSDVTAFYASARDGRPEVQDVSYDSPYNTRLYKGLPPGPIGAISDSSLRAVASPATTDYLYFVAGDNGVTYFSNTLAEHEALANQHCKKLCGR